MCEWVVGVCSCNRFRGESGLRTPKTWKLEDILRRNVVKNVTNVAHGTTIEPKCQGEFSVNLPLFGEEDLLGGSGIPGCQAAEIDASREA